MNVLDRIFAAKREAARARRAGALAEARARAADAPPARGFRRALESSPHPVALVAEVKRASPVQGVIREGFDPVEIARAYEAAGADCLSVLTDVENFLGDPAHLPACREATALPTLRKDFLVDETDVWEARALGADAVLLIVHGLGPGELRDMREQAESLGMDALVEAHTREEAETAVESGARLIGVNNRDLRTFEITTDVACEVIPGLIGRATVVSESALHSSSDVAKVAGAGARAVLIGTAFCAAPDPGAKVREVMGW